MKTQRRTFIKNLGFTVAGGALIPSAISCTSKESKNLTTDLYVDRLAKYSQKAKALVKDATCIDMLGSHGNHYDKRNGMPLTMVWEMIPDSFTEEDHAWVRAAGMDVFGWGSMKDTFESMLQFMAFQNGIVASNPEYFTRIDTKEKLQNLNASGKTGILITNQNCEHFRTEDDVDLFYAMGQRVSQLTYNPENRLGFGAFEDNDRGLKDYGKKIIERMNKVGMVVDVSHCGDRTTLDAVEASSEPILITHGACRAISGPLARTKTDEAIKAVAASGGVIGIPILRFMIRDREPVTMEDFFRHIDHVAELVGPQHVGIGSDQGLYTEDYYPLKYRKGRLENAPPKYNCHTNEDYLLTIEGLNHPFRVYDYAEGLIKRGYSDQEVKGVIGNNFKNFYLKVFKD